MKTLKIVEKNHIENREFSLFVFDNIKSERLIKPMSQAIQTHYENL